MVKKPKKEPYDALRAKTLALIWDAGKDLGPLSKALGKNPAYLHQYIFRGIPRVLPEELRHKLAELIKVQEEGLKQLNTGSTDSTRNWGDAEPEKDAHPVNPKDWSGELSTVRFRRFVEPVIAELFGDKAVSGLGDDFFTVQAEECVAQLEAWRESDPETPVTNHLALYLQSMLGGLNYALNGVHQMKPFQSYAFQTARLLLEPPAPSRKAK